MLHITNGKAANRRLRAAGIRGEFLSWDDPLHHGPVPGGLSLSELSEIRAAFIAENGWASLIEARERFSARDKALSSAASADQVVIWSSFELFDQLHLLQLLAWFEQHRDLVVSPAVVFVEGYLGSGELSDEELQGLLNSRREVSAPMQGTAAALWQAYCEPTPTQMVAWSAQKTPELPFMHEALQRVLEEYPGVDDGLSQTQRQVLEVLELGPMRLASLFRTAQALEPRPFMGDWSFWAELRGLIQAGRPAIKIVGEPPLLLPPQVETTDGRFRQQKMALTEFGERLLAGKTDFLALNRVVRWVGGVELDHETDWRWDRHKKAIIQAD